MWRYDGQIYAVVQFYRRRDFLEITYNIKSFQIEMKDRLFRFQTDGLDKMWKCRPHVGVVVILQHILLVSTPEMLKLVITAACEWCNLKFLLQ